MKALAYPPKIIGTPTPDLTSGKTILNCFARQSPQERGRVAFTLAEVLITLGIIGVVAAMTLPTLVQNYQKRVVETRLQKFYSAINQAVRLAEVEYGDKKIWFEDLAGATIDNEGRPVEGSSESEKWFNKYLAPHLKIIKQETLSDGTFIVYFPDGSALKQLDPTITRDWSFYPGNVPKCLEKYSNIEEALPTTRMSSGICEFAFIFFPNNKSFKWKYHYNKGFEPYKYGWDGTLAGLKDSSAESAESSYLGCSQTKRTYCTALIQYNGWKIPDDYPLKVSY